MNVFSTLRSSPVRFLASKSGNCDCDRSYKYPNMEKTGLNWYGLVFFLVFCLWNWGGPVCDWFYTVLRSELVIPPSSFTTTKKKLRKSVKNWLSYDENDSIALKSCENLVSIITLSFLDRFPWLLAHFEATKWGYHPVTEVWFITGCNRFLLVTLNKQSLYNCDCNWSKLQENQTIGLVWLVIFLVQFSSVSGPMDQTLKH